MRFLVAMGLALALLWEGSAGAEPEGEDVGTARAAFVDGNREFKLGHWRAAAAAWERGYERKRDPVFLYNIAQAYRLADATDQALDYYRRYLRDAPDGPNREQVSAHVEALERVVAERAPSPPPPTSVEAPPAIAPATAVSTIAPVPEPPRRFDLEADVGLATWAAGVPAATSPSLAVALGGGYTPLVRGRFALRLGALVGYTFLSDARTTDHFVTLLADPMVRLAVWRERLFVDGELGVGAQIVAGLAAGSPLLAARAAAGTRAAFALRPSLALEFRVTRVLAVRAGASVAYSPIADFADPSLVRVELLLAAVLRL